MVIDRKAMHTDTKIYAQVVLPLALKEELTYLVPVSLEDRTKVGSRVVVPLGERIVTGFIVGISGRSDMRNHEYILEAPDKIPLFNEEMLKLTKWISDYYLCSWGDVLKSALPSGIHSQSRRKLMLLKDMSNEEIQECRKRSPRQADILKAASQKNEISFHQLRRLAGSPGLYSAAYDLKRKGYVEIQHEIRGPRVKIKSKKVVSLVTGDAETIEAQIAGIERRAPKGAECLRILWENGGTMSWRHLRQKEIGTGTIKSLKKRNLVEIHLKEIVRDPFAHLNVEEPPDLKLTKAQRSALRAITDAIDKGVFKGILIHGITDSGKTLVYIEAIRRIVERSEGAIVLVPEISLTPQTVRRFKSNFGDKVAVLHSHMSDGERYDAWRKIKDGERPIAVGARSAIFAPVKKLGLIVVDEEHDSSYKQDTLPRYNARDVALMRGKIENAVVVLGSATPSLESYHNSQNGKLLRVELPDRVDNRILPKVTVVDMKQESQGGSSATFSGTLMEKISGVLERGEKIILLQNRRGYSPFIQCRECGFVFMCKRCRVSLTYHSTSSIKCILCHYCAFTSRVPTTCPDCLGYRLNYRGVGTQRVEDVLKGHFPNARVLRMDIDTTRFKGAHDTILESFRKGEADVLLGTQMISKGLDFPEVTLVGVISADTALNLPDFRSSERTFQLLTQVAGRAGRGNVPGEVIIQTYQPSSQAILCAKDHNFKAFWGIEAKNREELGYPPFGRLINIVFKGTDEDKVCSLAESHASFLRGRIDDPPIEILGPAQAPLGKIKDNFRYQVVLKSSSARAIHRLVEDASKEIGTLKSGVSVSVDVDPLNML